MSLELDVKYCKYVPPPVADLPDYKLNIQLVTKRPGYFTDMGWRQFMSVEDSFEWLDNHDVIQTDMEANTLHHFEPTARKWSIQFGSPTEQIVVDLETVDLYEYKDYLENSGKTIIGQNFAYDWIWLAKEGERGIVVYPDQVMDTFVAENSISLGMEFEFDPQGNLIGRYGRDLGALAKRYLGMDLPKEPRGLFKVSGLDSIEKIEYAGRDVMPLQHILSHQYEKIQEKQVVIDFYEECTNLVSVAYMQFCGMYLHYSDSDRNIPNWQDKCVRDEYEKVKAMIALDDYVMEHYQGFVQYIEYAHDIEKLCASNSKYNIPVKDYLREYQSMTFRKWLMDNYPEIPRKYMPDDFTKENPCRVNWSSPDKVKALFTLITIPIWDPKEKKESVKEDIIAPVAKDFPIVALYLNYKKAEKRCSTYGRSWEFAAQGDGRIHTSYKLAVSTGRLSSGRNKEPKMPNLQNLPGDDATRHSFRGQKGNMICAADFSDQEGHVSAQLTGDKGLLDFYNKGKGDKHAWVATMIWGVIFEDIKEAKRKKDNKEPLSDFEKKLLKYRSDAKGAGFALMYGGYWGTLMKNLGLSKSESQRIERDFFKVLPGLARFKDHQIQLAKKTGYILINPITGKKRFFDGIEEIRNMEVELEQIEKKTNGLFSNRKYMKEKWPMDLQRMAATPKNGKSGPERVKEAKAALSRYKELQSRIRKFWMAPERQAINTPVQGTAAIITKRATTYLFTEILKTRRSKTKDRFGKLKIINMVHDEILIEGHPRSIQAYSDLLIECMEKAAKDFCPDLDMKAVPAIGRYWIH